MMEFFDYNTFLMEKEAIFDLAAKYEYGDSVDKCSYIAADLYFKSAAKGHIPAQGKVVLMRLLNQNVFPSYISIDQNWYDTTLAELSERAEDGDAEAYRLLGFAYEDGFGVDKDHKKAFEYLNKSMDMGNLAAINAIGYMYAYGYGVDEDRGTAIKYYQLAADKGFHNASCNLAWGYANGRGVNEDKIKAFDLYKDAAFGGHARGQYRYANMLFDGDGIEKDIDTAFEYCSKAAHQGYKWAQKLLGDMYFDGIGTNKNIEEALLWYCKAAEQEYEDAIDKLDNIRRTIEIDDIRINDSTRERLFVILYRENRIGWPYDYIARNRGELDYIYPIEERRNHYDNYLRRDNTIPIVMFLAYVNFETLKILKATNNKDLDKKAVNWLEQGRLIGDASSISFLGECYANDMPATDYTRAYSYFQEASEMGFFRASYLLGELYFNGKGVERNINNALNLFFTAAENQIGEACYTLGNFYMNGDYIEQDYAKASQFFSSVTENNCKNKNFFSNALCNLAFLYQFGLGVERDILKAANMYLESNDDEGTSFCNYAWMIHHNEGFLNDEMNAVEWYEKAIDKANPRAMYNLALMFIKGDSVVSDYQKAITLLNKATEKNEPHSQLIVSIANKVGFIVAKNRKRAKELFRAANKKNPKHKWYQYIRFWLFGNKNMIMRAVYLQNRTTPESKVHFDGMQGLVVNKNDFKLNSRYELESFISKIIAKDPIYSAQALKLVIAMFEKGIGVPKSDVFANYWKNYELNYNGSVSNHDRSEDSEPLPYDIQKELERKFDELFGSFDEDDEEITPSNKKAISPKYGEPADHKLKTPIQANDGYQGDKPDNSVILNDEMGNEVLFEFLDLINYESEEFVVLLPIDSIENQEVIILRVETSENNEESYVSVDDEQALSSVFNIFKEKFRDEYNFIV